MPEARIDDPADIRLNEQYEVQQLMGDPPGWMLRYGILLVALIVLALVAIAYFVRFPDLLVAPGVITSERPPVRVAPRTAGELRSVFAADRDSVREGQLLALIDNAADPAAVEILAKWVRALAVVPPETWPDVPHDGRGELGELQPAFAALQQDLRDLDYFVSKDKTRRRVRYLRDQIGQLEGLNDSRLRQRRILREEARLAQRNLTRDSLLVIEGARSAQELERTRAVLLDLQRRAEDLRSTVYRNNIQVQELNRQILDLRQQQGSTVSDKLLDVRADYDRLRGALDEWNARYRITAPLSGKVSIPVPLSPGRFVAAGEPLLTILPDRTDGMIARAALPLAGAGKVRPGLRANIRLADYPYRQFGTLQGTVRQIALVPQDDRYLLTVDLPDTLLTTYGVNIPFRQEMQGQVTVVTENRRLLVRLFDRLWSLIKNS